MCGVAGIVHLDGAPVDPAALLGMTDAIAHRGPDGQGMHVEESVGLGHRRLAILDLSDAGRQPMVTADGRVVLSYNGEVYNFRELRSELEGLGHRFLSGTDTEVVLHAWEEWGVDCVGRFNGMFAFAVWDKRDGCIHLVRDRYGIKPMYWGRWGSTLLFGSEQKAILAHPDSRMEIDFEALLEYFTFQNIFTERTLTKNIQLLPGGCVARIPVRNGDAIQVDRYWEYDFREPDGSVDERAYEEEVDRLLRQAVSRQLVSDVELGSYLSGGMDSGTLTSLASRELPYIKTFTCGFDLSSASGIELTYDERAKAEAMSAVFKTEHYEMVLKAGDMERVLPRLTHHLEEPRIGQSYPNFYAAQLASKFVKVVLSGAGGDELFCGYPWRYYRTVGSASFEDYIDNYYAYWQRLIDNRTLKRVFAPIKDRVEGVWTRDIFRDVFSSRDLALNRPEDLINHSLHFEARTFLHGLLVVEDKLSMAHGLESRVPFLDNDLVDFAMQCPVRLKLENLGKVIQINENEATNKPHTFFERTNDGKQILRRVMRKYIPTEIVESCKQGFSAPDASWFKGESIEFVRSRLFEGDPIIYSYLDRDVVQDVVLEHLEGRTNRRLFIWSMLSVEEWLQQSFGEKPQGAAMAMPVSP